MNSGKPLSVPVAPVRRNITLLGRDREQECLLEEEEYDSDGGTGPFIDAAVFEVDIDYHLENTLMEYIRKTMMRKTMMWKFPRLLKLLPKWQSLHSPLRWQDLSRFMISMLN